MIDFSQFAGKTLIVYNDAPAPVPAFDPRNDYYTGAPDQTSSGGAPSTLPGYGPNTRTIMQIKVNATGAANVPPFSLTTLKTNLPTIFAGTQEQIIVPEPAFPTANGGAATPTYARIQDTSLPGYLGTGSPLGGITLTSGGAGYTAAPNVTLGAPQLTGGVQATAAAALAPTSVGNLQLLSGGSGYTSVPTVAFNGGGGTGAAATAALASTGVASATVTNRGSGYTSVPTVTFSPPPAGTTAAGTAVVVNRRVTAITITNPGTGYFTAPTINITGGGGSGARAVAVLAPTTVASVTLTNGGTGYTSAPTVSFLGGGATTNPATAAATLTPDVVASITLTNPGSGYTAAPTITIDPPQTAGSTATATIVAPLTPFQPKAIQELFTLDYGRMNATFGVEVPFTNFLTQTTIPYGYVDPPTELFQDGDTQIWKITHNGVDTHFIHFHLFTVQVLNRVGWDGMIKPPDDNEVAWKDTVRMNPLEDVIVALHPLQQSLPWQLPLSQRPMDVTESIGSAMPNQFTNIDPTNQPAAVTNDMINFGYEYVWHCHILGHEENDMMRAMMFAVPPAAPSTLAQVASPPGNRAVKLTWVDNALNETGFTIQRSITNPGVTPGASWVTVGTAPAMPGTGGTASFVDLTVAKNTVYWYQVIADNLVGYEQVYAAPAVGYPTLDATSTPLGPLQVTTGNANVVAPFSASFDPYIFASSFKVGTLGWTGVVGTVQAVNAAEMGPDGNKLGMAADLSAPLGSFVFYHTLAGITTYNAAFEFNPNGAVSGSSPVDIFVGLDQNSLPAFGIQYQKVMIEAEPVYQVRSWVQLNGDQAFSNWATVENLPTRLGLAWTSGASGALSLYANDVLAQTLTGDTSGSQLYDAVMGPSGGLSGASGTMYFDEFTSNTLNGVGYSVYLPVTTR